MNNRNAIYWKNKEERAQKAKEHTEKMASMFVKKIKDCINNTVVYNSIPDDVLQGTNTAHSIKLLDTDSVSAIFDVENNNIAVLNFASYKNPGGMFVNGSSAQEESLCMESFLYNVLKEFNNSYYAENRKSLNKALYLDKALYSPGVGFFRDKKARDVAVITCAAPNYYAANKYQRVDKDTNHIYLLNRIRLVLAIAEEQGVKNLILGAYGCGVFGQDPVEVAQIFKEELFKMKNSINVYFAIPDKNSKNYKAFEQILNDLIKE